MSPDQSQCGVSDAPPAERPRTDPPRDDLLLSLAWAIVASSATPLVLLDGQLNIVLASTSFCDAFEIKQDAAKGRSFLGLGSGEWDAAGLRALLEDAASGRAEVPAFELSLVRAGQAPRQLVLNAHKLDYADAAQVRLILGVVDTTEARNAAQVKDDQLREKAILLQDVRHRIANSLQIIAGVLLQAARQAQSEDARSHLRNAHSRVMSVAALERQLSASSLGQVAARSYLGQLCTNIGASMIEDPDRIQLELVVDDSVLEPQISISLGLIVTELVINALKHAFPDGRTGKVTVSYRSEGGRWDLSVADDGVGRPAPSDPETHGLGTMIIAALAKQLRASVEIAEGVRGVRTYVRST